MTRNGNTALFRRFLLVAVLGVPFASGPGVALGVAKNPLRERIQVVGGIQQWDPVLRKGRGVVVLRDSVSQKTLGVQIGRNVLVGGKSFTVGMTRQEEIVLTRNGETIALTPAEVPKDQTGSSPETYADGNSGYGTESMDPERPDLPPDDAVMYAEEEEPWNDETGNDGNTPTWEEDRYDTYAPEDYEHPEDAVRYEDGGYEDGGYEDAVRYEDGDYEDTVTDGVRANPFERGWGPGE